MSVPEVRLLPTLLVPLLIVAHAAAPRSPAPPEKEPAGAGTVTYTVSDGFSSWVVHQGADLTVVRTMGSPDEGGGEIVMVAGPAVGGPPASMVRNVQVLARTLGGPVRLGPGHVSRSVYGGTAVLDSIRFALRPGDTPTTIGGRNTTHRVLTLEAWWIDQGEDGTRTPVRETGRADLWFAGDLAFSRIPLTIPPAPGAVGGALPLSFHHPEVAGHVLEQVISELEPLGLLLRARVLDSVVPDPSPTAVIRPAGMALERSIEVDSIRSVAEEPSAPGLTGLPVLTAEQGLALEIGFIAMGEPCSEERTTGSFEFSTDGPVALLAGGAGASLRDGEGLGHASVVMGGGGRTLIECTLVIFSDSARAPGSYRVVAPSLPAFAGPEKAAIVMHILVDSSRPAVTRFLALEQGEVRLDRADGQEVKGVIKGTGWVAELDTRRRQKVEEGVGVTTLFEAAAEAGNTGRF